ncbi:protein CLEC16A isoform X3 [Leucoraja erinacea]|uniref:protein CLEC16A isoform X3 n=1 Tax=Leucoraja erinaceus TaxID=7782 RepID=UPI002456DE92|nr:protein CLEC16A isoform X3 [Leucoraja erinacea]
MLHYIRDKTAVPYFSNLVWFIGSHVIELDNCVQTDEEHRNRGKLSDLVAEHLDHLHYLNDILTINCEFLNDVLTDHLLNRLFLPLYVYSLVTHEQCGDRPKISRQASLYLLSQVFLIIHFRPLVNSLAEVILNGDLSMFGFHSEQEALKHSLFPTPLTNSSSETKMSASIRCFTKPVETLERSLEISRHKGRKRVQKRPNYKNVGEEDEEEKGIDDKEDDTERLKGTDSSAKGNKTSGETEEIEMVIMERCKISGSQISGLMEQNTTDEEKTAAATRTNNPRRRPFLDLVYKALECFEEDYYALFVLCLLFAISHNTGVDSDLLEKIQIPPENAKEKSSYSHVLAERLIKIMNQSTRSDAKIRLATLELACLLLRQLVLSDGTCIIKDVHLACHEGAREESVHLLRRFYKGEDIFLDMFEDEYRVMMSKPLNVEYLMMDASILLPPTGTPLTGIDFVKRLPCGDVERTRRAIRVFLMLRSLSLQLQGEPETQLPLTREEDLIKTDDVLDLNNSDLIACTVVSKDIGQVHRFLAVDVYQMSLVEPENKRLGWGVVKFAGLLQDMQVMGVEDDSRALNIIIHKPASNPHARPFPILQATFIFADHIRCIIAKQRLAKGRIQARRMKMQRIAVLLDLPVQTSSEVMGFGHGSPSSAHHLPFRFYDQSRQGVSDPTVQRSVFASVDKVPGFAVAQHINQQSPSPASSPSPPSSGTITTSTGYSDTITTSVASTPSATQSPTDGPELQEQSHLTFPDQVEFVNEAHFSPPTAEGGSSCYHLPSSTEPEAANLAPSLTPAHQPTISLISDDNTDALSVESLTLLPPADAQHIRSVSTLSQTSALSESNGMIENEDNNRQSEVSESMHGRHHNV